MEYNDGTPPPGEHASLHRHAQALLKRPPVVLSPPLRTQVRDAIIEKAARGPMDAVLLSVSGMHVHLLAYMSRATAKTEIGKLKRHSSHAIRDQIPGAVWAASCDIVPVTERDHYRRLFDYILGHQQEGAAIWRWQETETDLPIQEGERFFKPPKTH